MDTRSHYEQHLAAHYTWIYGGFDRQRGNNEEFFSLRGITPRGTGVAIDLGAGPGFQSVPLADAGFRVTAVDFSPTLLEEIRIRAGTRSIEIVNADMMDFTAYAGKSPELIVCMGDTLTHLTSMDHVRALIANCHSELVDAGLLILGFRDLTVELVGSERFIPVRSEKERIFVCVLDYHRSHVTVNDLVYEYDGSAWRQSVSSYEKLRIPPDTVRDCMVRAGFTIDEYTVTQGIVMVKGTKN